MASKAASKRLQKEYLAMQRDPPPFVWAAPEERDILVWNYIIRGPPDSPYDGGEYHGVILFPSEYPFKPPGIKMLTPSGRFQPNKRICFSMSDYHPGTWNPGWSVSTILTGLLSFMVTNEMTAGSVEATDADRKALAVKSHAHNVGQSRFRDAFPQYSSPQMIDLPNMGDPRARQRPPSAPSSSLPTPASGQVKDLVPARDPENTFSWTFGLGQILADKWRWGVFLAIAILISRVSTAR